MAIIVNHRLAIIGVLCLALFGSPLVRAENAPEKDQASLSYQQGQEQFRAHRFQEAESYFKKALENDPSHCPSFMGLLHTYLIMEDLEERPLAGASNRLPPGLYRYR